jgi:hypothetical protein
MEGDVMFGKDKKEYPSTAVLMGEPIDYWIDLRSQVEALSIDAQMARNLKQKQEIYGLRAKVSYYESKIQDLATFMKFNLEVNDGA